LVKRSNSTRCFISYSSKDEEFVRRLHADLQDRGVRCWFAPEDMKIGARVLDTLDEAIRLRDKVLIVLSRASVASEWVEDEVTKAFAEERRRGAVVLFPVRIDDAVFTTEEAWALKLHPTQTKRPTAASFGSRRACLAEPSVPTCTMRVLPGGSVPGFTPPSTPIPKSGHTSDGHRFGRLSLRSVKTAFKAASTSRRSADAAICQYASVVAPPAIDLAMSAISRLHDPRIDVATAIASDLWSSTDCARLMRQVR
jgi:hypothetical protein